MTRERVRSWLSVLGVLALFLSVMPSYEYRGGSITTQAEFDHVRGNPNDMPYVENHRFGWYDSPLVHHHKARTLKVSDGGRVSVGGVMRTQMNWVSWSGLTLAAGVGLLLAAQRLRPVPPKPPEPVS